jgi:hypothetical protein
MNPIPNQIENRDYKSKIKGTLLTFIIYLAAAIAVFIFLNLVDTLVIKYFFDHSILEQLKLSNKNINKEFGRYSFLIIVLFGPLYEEVIFRLPLKLEKVGIGISVGLIFYRLLVKHIFIFEFADPYAYVKVVMALIVTLLIAKFLPIVWLTYLKKNYFYFFYLIAIIFALVHVGNFDYYNNSVLLFYPLFTLPQFLMALLIGYTRIEFGFFYGVALHSLINLPSFLLNL